MRIEIMFDDDNPFILKAILCLLLKKFILKDIISDIILRQFFLSDGPYINLMSYFRKFVGLDEI